MMEHDGDRVFYVQFPQSSKEPHYDFDPRVPKNRTMVPSEPSYYIDDEEEDQSDIRLIRNQFHKSSMLVNLVNVTEFQVRTLANRRGRPPSLLT